MYDSNNVLLLKGQVIHVAKHDSVLAGGKMSVPQSKLRAPESRHSMTLICSTFKVANRRKSTNNIQSSFTWKINEITSFVSKCLPGQSIQHRMRSSYTCSRYNCQYLSANRESQGRLAPPRIKKNDNSVLCVQCISDT